MKKDRIKFEEFAELDKFMEAMSNKIVLSGKLPFKITYKTTNFVIEFNIKRHGENLLRKDK